MFEGGGVSLDKGCGVRGAVRSGEGFWYGVVADDVIVVVDDVVVVLAEIGASW